jgi:hypothetical protein
MTMSKIYENGIYRELTAEEIAQQQAEERKQYQSMDYGDIVETLIRQKYSLSAELAILRQRDSKPEEFAEYNAYAEECKTEAKSILQGVEK